MKRMITILLSVALLVANINVTIFAEEKGLGIVYIESVTGTVGDTIIVPVGIKNNQGVISMVTEILYDTTALKLVSVNKNTDFWESANMTPGGDIGALPYRIIWYDGLAKVDFTKDGILAELSFKILKEGSHKIELSVSDGDTFNSNFDRVPFTVNNGVITASSESSLIETTTTETTTTVTEIAETISSATQATTTSTKNEDKTSNLSMRNLTGAVGDIINMPISIQNNPGIISLLVELSFDSTALKLVDVKKNSEFWEESTMTPGGDLGFQPYRIIWYDGLAKSDFTDNGILAELSFEVLKPGSHRITLSASDSDTFNSKLISVPLEVSNGVIDTSPKDTAQIIETIETTTSTATTETVTTTEEGTFPTETTSASSDEGTSSVLLGDVTQDGNVNASDATEILIAAAAVGAGEPSGLTREQIQAADVNSDGAYNASDATIVLIYAAAVGAGQTDAKVTDFC